MYDDNGFERISSVLEEQLFSNEHDHDLKADIALLDRLNDYNDMFISLLLDNITEALGHSRWAVLFVEKRPYNGAFWADIYVDNIPAEFDIVSDIIKTLVPMQMEMAVWYKGLVENYLHLQASACFKKI